MSISNFHYAVTLAILLSKFGHVLRSLVHFFCGVFSGCVTAAAVNPLEVIKVRQMIDKEATRNLIQGGKKVYRSGGILAFYEGLSAAIVQVTEHFFLLNDNRLNKMFILDI